MRRLTNHRAGARLSVLAWALAERHTAWPEACSKNAQVGVVKHALLIRPFERPAGQKHTDHRGDDGADLQVARCFAEKPPPTE